MAHQHYFFVLVAISACVLAQNFENLDVLDDICPPVGNHTETVFLDSGECDLNPNLDCRRDEQCNIGSKCCPLDSCEKRCVELKTGRVTIPKINKPEEAKTQRRRRQVVGCVACATCVRRCESSRECTGRRNRCYHNTCSSYCTI